MYTGLKTINNGLVYGYDTGYGSADKNTSTRFYKGRPTTNLINFANSDLNNWTSYDNGNNGTFTTEFGTLGLKINNKVSWNGAYRAFTLPSTGTYTYSAWFRYRGGASNNNGAAVYVSSYGGSDTSTWLDKSIIGEWQRVSKTVNVTDVTTMFYLISYGGSQSNGDSSSWDVTMPQIEKLSDETPFVNGSRSNTTSLIDLKRTNNIDVSNMSFDSTSQPVFDGTDDILNTGLFSGRNPSTEHFTIEAIVKSDTTSGNHMWVDATGNGSNQRFYCAHASTGSSTPLGIQNSGWSHSIPQDTNYHHYVITMNGSTAQLYNNGVAHSNKSYTSYTLSGQINVGGRNGYRWNGEIPVFKIYDRVLTTAEITQNYNAYKNRFNI
jgi:hypothetical protein